MAQTTQRTAAAPRQAPPKPANAVADLSRRAYDGAERFAAALLESREQIAAYLPHTVGVERFIRTAQIAIAQTPELLMCDRPSLMNSLTKCAIDGLIPDGREAVILPFRTIVKIKDPESGIEHQAVRTLAQYMPMIQGVRERMRRSGLVISAVAEVVYEKDAFAYALGDNAFVEHRPPALGDDRGSPVGVYAIIRLTSGEVLREVMSTRDVEYIRNTYSKAKDSPAWKNRWPEMARKTVLKLCAKQAPQRAGDLENMVGDDDIDPNAEAAFRHVPLPNGEHFTQDLPPTQDVVESDLPELVFDVVDLDGEAQTFRDENNAVRALSILMAEAAKQGPARLEGLWESNDLGTWSQDAQDQMRDEYIDRLNTAKTPRVEPQGSPQASETRPSVDHTSQLDNAHQGAPPAPAQGADAGQGSLAVGSPPVQQKSYAIEPVRRAGKEDWFTWAKALFLPKLKKQTDSTELAYFLGDNEHAIERAKAALNAVDRAELEDAIEAQKRAAT